LEVLGVGKLLEIRDKRNVFAENLAVGLHEEKWGNSTQKGMKQFLHMVLFIVVDQVSNRPFMNGWKDSKGNCVLLAAAASIECNICQGKGAGH
jgi:hypothetical protein